MYEQRPPPEPEPDDPGADETWLPGTLAERADGGEFIFLRQFRSEFGPLFEQRARPDRYVVVDELGEDYCRLTVDPWPDLDADGRLKFGNTETVALTVDLGDFQETVNRQRQRSSDDEIEAAARPIRIGDTFAVYLRWQTPLVPGPDKPGQRADSGDAFHNQWRQHFDASPDLLVDVTGDARTASHAAAEAAVTGTLTVSEASKLGFDLASEPQQGSRDAFGTGTDDEPPRQET